ncbi:HU family DNA-binding protein [Deinococcus radiotolerans]|uniref:DNA-binding protein HU n=1 Tax=Deinococcus radiotolerans TaxID=1309407 RepID=A0ABQ2FQI1_9DEIO|nr:HU family DNA-binding protein [Deinococcus radiotolerans]GGL16888.1 DNA-binding protein HU [Deinococcus radiotolerans]
MTKTPTRKPAAAKSATKSPTSKIAKTELVDQIADKTGLTKKQAGDAFDTLVDGIVDGLKNGQSVGLPGLGTLSVRPTAARTGVRPGTSEKIQIPAGKKVAFKVASTLKDTL